MKQINESSTKCAELNAANAEAIKMGFIEEVQPTKEILEKEQRDTATLKNIEVVNTFCKTILSRLSEPARSVYTGETVRNQYWGKYSFSGPGPSVEVEAYHSSSGYRSEFSYWRLNIGSYGDTKRLKIGEKLIFTEELIGKAVLAIEEKVTHQILQHKEKAQREAKQSEKSLFFKANDEIMKALNLSQYDSAVGGDKWYGNVRVVATAAQLERLAALLAEFKAENQPQAVNA